jgi:hypothetical protein
MSICHGRPSSPILRAWSFLIIFWPLSDALRKWGGLNQPVYALQMLFPFLIAYFLWRRNALVLHRSILTPVLLLTAVTGVTALYYSMTDYSVPYLGVWFLSLSALVGPALLLCAKVDILPSNDVLSMKRASSLVAITSLLSFVNNILTTMQSVLGRSHVLSATAGGVLDAQIATNTEIELRSPGFFTFVLGNAGFSAICIIFLLSSFSIALPQHTIILRSFALLSLPMAVARSISRSFLFLVLSVSVPWIQFLIRARFLLWALIIALLLLFLGLSFPGMIETFAEGYSNFERRITDAGGVSEGIVARFFSSFYLHEGGGTDSLFFHLVAWLRSDLLAGLFGYGLGFSGPLFRFSQGIKDTAYGYVYVENNEFIVGETFYPSLLSDIGIINLFIYFWMVVNLVKVFLRSFPFFPLIISRAYVHSSYIAFILAIVNPTTPYFRPLSVFFFSASILTPFVCQILFDSKSVEKMHRLRLQRGWTSP